MYDVVDHPLLSPEAYALDEPVLAEWALAAAFVLGFYGVEFEGERLQAAATAVVLVVNASVAHASEDMQGRVVESERKGNQAFTYKVSNTGREMAIPFRARAIAEALLGSAPPVGTVPHTFAW